MMTSMITLYPLTLTCATLLVCTQGASIRSEYGVIEKNKLYQSGAGDFPQLVLPYMSLVHCAVFCVERGFTKWACNYKKGANEVTCEAHDVASGLLDSDVITSTGDSLVYKEGAYGAPPPPPGKQRWLMLDLAQDLFSHQLRFMGQPRVVVWGWPIIWVIPGHGSLHGISPKPLEFPFLNAINGPRVIYQVSGHS